MRTVVIIGGASGIGDKLIKDLLEEGCRVIATYHKKAIEIGHDNLEVYPLNVMDEVLDLSFIPNEIHGLVYCPGSINLMPFNRIKPQDFLSDYNLQVLGAIKVIQGLGAALKVGKGSVVLYSTVAVQTGFNFHSQVAASKGAIEGLSKALAAEFAPNVRFNVVAPSITQTPLAAKFLNTEEKIKANSDRHPLKKIGQAHDIANMTAFLLSDKSSWITGQVFTVDGGISTLKV